MSEVSPDKDAGLPSEVADRIGPFYVYVLVDPRDGHIFYVGKGTGDRVSAHGRAAGLESDVGESAKVARIRQIRGSGVEPLIDVVRHHIGTDLEAFRVEAALIACLPSLTNVVAGHDVEAGRTSLDELVVRYGAPAIGDRLDTPVLMIRLANRWTVERQELEPGVFREGNGWKPRITSAELYDSVRAWWKVSPVSSTRRGGSSCRLGRGRCHTRRIPDRRLDWATFRRPLGLRG